MWYKELEDPEEKQVLDQICEELDIKGEKPMWFHPSY
jgi:hypothetical protein